MPQNNSNDILTRLIELEKNLEFETERRQKAEEECDERISELSARLTNTEKFIAYMRGTATKYGSALMGALALGTIIVMGVDKLKEKIIAWFLP